MPIMISDYIRSDYIRRQSVESNGSCDGDALCDVYRAAATVESASVIDIGCGRAEMTIEHFGDRHIYGIDYRDRLAECRRQYPQYTWLEIDLEDPNFRLDDLPVDESVIVCANVVEKLRNPQPLLNALNVASRSAKAMFIATPERELVHGVSHLGPPTDPCHAREWSMKEFRNLLSANNIDAELGLCRATDACSHPKSILAKVRQTTESGPNSRWWDDLPADWWDFRPDLDSDAWSLAVQIANAVPGARSINEVACGAGKTSERLCQEEYAGFDLSKRAIGIARQRYPQHRFINGDFRNCLQPADVTLAGNVLGHLPHFDEGLRRMFQKTRLCVIVLFVNPICETTQIRLKKDHNGRFYDNSYSERELRDFATYHGWTMIDFGPKTRYCDQSGLMSSVTVFCRIDSHSVMTAINDSVSSIG